MVQEVTLLDDPQTLSRVCTRNVPYVLIFLLLLLLLLRLGPCLIFYPVCL